MVQIEAGVEFPVILYNGERQIDVGDIKIHPTTDFHSFRTMLKEMTGISYNNLTSYLVETQTYSETQSDPRKLLITSKVDFNVLMREKNAYFLVRMNDINNVMMHDQYFNYEYDSHVNENFPDVTEEYIPLVERSVNRGRCEDCDRANERGLKPEFHMCVYDDVVEGFFRSPAGPISRPLTR
ncbi:hypothetical protein QVD17_11479 [Tagetes erecta]|uniref:DUF7138 domain-containing protein n=1 Tax=Tagetes erecta TaxID=13708 RepID=A0AAD8P0X8_TARER|nr:hypothetical protein QVD17_11479 [Tagetes erecta]